jgi:hypothetical protein
VRQASPLDWVGRRGESLALPAVRQIMEQFRPLQFTISSNGMPAMQVYSDIWAVGKYLPNAQRNTDGAAPPTPGISSSDGWFSQPQHQALLFSLHDSQFEWKNEESEAGSRPPKPCPYGYTSLADTPSPFSSCQVTITRKPGPWPSFLRIALRGALDGAIHSLRVATMTCIRSSRTLTSFKIFPIHS